MHAFVTLLHAQDVVWKRKGAQFAEYGIPQGRFMVMIMLMRKVGEGCPRVHSPGEIAEQLQVTRASLTGLLDSWRRIASYVASRTRMTAEWHRFI